METASTMFGSFAESEQAQDVFDAQLGEDRCDRGAGVQIAQRHRVGLAVAAVPENRHMPVFGAEILFELGVPGEPIGKDVPGAPPVGLTPAHTEVTAVY